MSLMQLLLASAPASGIVTSGLVMYLDAGNTSSYPGSGTAWTDLTGNGNNGTLTNGPTYSAADGGQIVFDGTNDYTAIAGSSSLAFNTGDFTIECWFKLTSTSFSYGQIWDIHWGAANENGYYLRFGDAGFGNRLQFGTTSVGVNDSYNVSDTKTSLLNTWVSFVHTRLSGENRAYKNGASVNFAQGTGGPPYSLSSFTDSSGSTTLYNHRLAERLGGGLPFPGNIAITRAYNIALSPSQVLQNFNTNRGRFGL